MNREPKHPDSWETRPGDRPWPSRAFDPSDGVVQGPEDLSAFAGKGLDLALDDGQIALLTVRGDLRRCLLPGAHALPVGGEGGLPADGRLYVLHLERTLLVPWRQHMPVRATEGGAPGPRLAHGSFGVRIVRPAAFYEALLRERAGAGEDICLATLAHLLPTFLAIRMTRTEPARSGDDLGSDGLAARAARLPHRCLDEDLHGYGLTCVSWSITDVDERRAATPPREPVPV